MAFSTGRETASAPASSRERVKPRQPGVAARVSRPRGLTKGLGERATHVGTSELLLGGRCGSMLEGGESNPG